MTGRICRLDIRITITSPIPITPNVRAGHIKQAVGTVIRCDLDRYALVTPHRIAFFTKV